MRMMMKLIHAVVAAVTAVLLYIKQGYAFTTGMKLRNHSTHSTHCSREKLESLDIPPSDGGDNVCAVCARASRSHDLYTACQLPKYKRDPEISVDNEVIGKHPCDYYN